MTAIEPLAITACTTVSALGQGRAAALHALHEGTSGLRPCDFDAANPDTWIGRVEGLEDAPLRGACAAFDCRNNRLAYMGLQQDGFADAVAAARERLGPRGVGVFIGTSTSGIQETEFAYQAFGGERLPAGFSYRHTQDVFSAADFVRQQLGLTGPAAGISTACSSSAKVFASAWRHIRAGLCEAAVVGGVDSLCLTTLCGFHSLGLISSRPCRPWDAARDGLNIGEAAGFALLEPVGPDCVGVALLGYGESADAYHMSAAHPEGAGAALAMGEALERAGLAPEAIDYINLHGTATASNDAAEDAAVLEVFGADTPCSSTKGWTGHTLGAAGVIEAVIACLCIEHGLMPMNLHLEHRDPRLRANVLTAQRSGPVHRIMSNSFGFGGSNCSLIFGRLP